MTRVLIAAAISAAILAGAAASAGPPLREQCVLKSDHASVVRFPASDGVRLAGVLFGRGPTAVVLAHQLGGDLCQWLFYGRALRNQGFRVLAFDFRGFGSSASVTPANLDRDIVGAVRELRRRGVRTVFVMGASMGGTAVLAAAARVKPLVAGVIDLSGPVEFAGVNALASIRRLSAPALFLAARDDLKFAAATRTLFRAAGTKEKQLVIRPGFAHGVDLVSGDDGAAVRKLVLAFLRKHAR